MIVGLEIAEEHGGRLQPTRPAHYTAVRLRAPPTVSIQLRVPYRWTSALMQGGARPPGSVMARLGLAIASRANPWM